MELEPIPTARQINQQPAEMCCSTSPFVTTSYAIQSSHGAFMDSNRTGQRVGAGGSNPDQFMELVQSLMSGIAKSLGGVLQPLLRSIESLTTSVQALLKENQRLVEEIRSSAQLDSQKTQEATPADEIAPEVPSATEEIKNPESAQSTRLSHREGFLWKPISERDGNLAVLLPEHLAGKVKRVSIRSKGGKVLETGNYSGNGNGGRDHFRFTKPGSKFPDHSVVEIQLKSGSIRTITISETSKRYEPIK